MMCQLSFETVKRADLQVGKYLPIQVVANTAVAVPRRLTIHQASHLRLTS
jgi:hypothetical protein